MFSTKQLMKPLKATVMTAAKTREIKVQEEKQRSGSNHVPRIRPCAAQHIQEACLPVREVVSLGEYFYDVSKALRSFKILGTSPPTTERYIPQDFSLHQYCCKIVKSYLLFFKDSSLVGCNAVSTGKITDVSEVPCTFISRDKRHSSWIAGS
jgi:hypothetical protein